jgi:hypothetical protein
MSKRVELRLYTPTSDYHIAHVELRREERAGRVYLYLQWKDGERPRKVYVGKLAGPCCNRRRR